MDTIRSPKILRVHISNLLENIISISSIIDDAKGLIKTRAEKTGRNISQNTAVIIPAHNIPAFKPSKTFVKSVKQNVPVS